LSTIPINMGLSIKKEVSKSVAEVKVKSVSVESLE
jgi:hypothetical protein